MPLPPLVGSQYFTAWQPAPGEIASLIVIGVAYLSGVRALRSRGDRWKIGRSISFIGGLGTIAVATMSSLGAYDDQLFWIHTVQHILLAMVAPLFLVLGAPITLGLRTGPATLRRWLLATIHHRVARVLVFPPVGASLLVATLFALYFTPLYQQTLTHPLLHAVLHVHFVVVGCLFLLPIIGVDPIPARPTYPLRLLILFVTMPAHAFLGIALMSLKRPIAGDYYFGLHRTWGPAPLADDHLGGGILWASGELITLCVVAALFVQWSRSDQRASSRSDRRADRAEQRSEGSELATYNAYLARLNGSAEDRQPSATTTRARGGEPETH